LTWLLHVEDNIGYIRLVEFQENTPKDLKDALKDLKERGMDSLLIDLRNNPGGLLNVSVEVAEMFLAPRNVVVSTRGRVKKQNIVYKSSVREPYLGFPLVILVNEGSASASEIVAGAIRDNKRGLIVGTKSFGKGSVQTLIPLKDGSAIRLTTAEYFTPSGKPIHNEGVIPDVVVVKITEPSADAKKDEGPEKDDVFENMEDEDEEKEEEERPKPKRYDNQLKAAIDLIKGIKAYEALKETS